MKFSYVLLGLALSGAAWFLINMIQYYSDRKKLRSILNTLFSKGGDEMEPGNEKEKLSKLMTYLQTTISFQNVDRSKNRKNNLLRATAVQVAESGEGFCGENARLAINLMDILGIKSCRLYLTGKKWGHVLTECKIDGRWWFFDGHYDPETAMNVQDIGKLPSPQISLLKNGYNENGWVDYNRIKVFSKIPFLRTFSKARLPSFIVLLFENPHLIKAAVGFFFFAVCLGILLVIHQ